MKKERDQEDIRDQVSRELSVDLWPTAGRALNLERNAAYAAAKRGEIPTNRFGRRLTVPTAPLRKMLGLETGTAA